MSEGRSLLEFGGVEEKRMSAAAAAAETLRLGTLKSVHALVWLRVALVAVCTWVWNTVLYVATHKGSKLECIHRDVKDLKKLPVHLAVVVNEKRVSYGDLARLVNWSFAVGIHHVSLYDPRGVLRRELESLRRAVEQEHGNLFPSSSEPLTICSSEDCQEPHPQHGVHSLLVLGPGDGRGNLASVASSLCASVLQQRTTLDEIDCSFIDRKLTGGSSQGYPDPNLAMVVGGPPSLLGYLPWQTRLTEILFIPSHHKITYQKFFSLLYRYANTTQRFGK